MYIIIWSEYNCYNNLLQQMSTFPVGTEIAMLVCFLTQNARPIDHILVDIISKRNKSFIID